MKPKLLLRIASGLMLFFAIGHTMGHLGRHDTTDPKAREVLQAMSDNKFDMFGQLRSYDENYTGMSLNLIFTLLAFAAVLWLLSGLSEKDPAGTRNLLIPICLCVAAFTVTSYLYFFLVPAVTCLLATLTIGMAIAKLGR